MRPPAANARPGVSAVGRSHGRYLSEVGKSDGLLGRLPVVLCEEKMCLVSQTPHACDVIEKFTPMTKRLAVVWFAAMLRECFILFACKNAVSSPFWS